MKGSLHEIDGHSLNKAANSENSAHCCLLTNTLYYSIAEKYNVWTRASMNYKIQYKH